MTGLAIILCAVLFASASSAVNWTDTLRTVEDSVERAIEDATSKVEADFVTTQLRTTKIAADLADRANDFGVPIWDEISLVTQNVTEELKKFNGRARGLCIKDCLAFSQRLGRIALLAIKTTRDCINYPVKIGFARIDTVNRASNEAMVELGKIREASQRCGENVDDPRSAAAVIVCFKATARDATWVPIKSAPKLTVGWTRLKFLLVTLERSFDRCRSNKRLATFYQESSTVVERTAECVQHTIDEARKNHRSIK